MHYCNREWLAVNHLAANVYRRKSAWKCEPKTNKSSFTTLLLMTGFFFLAVHKTSMEVYCLNMYENVIYDYYYGLGWPNRLI
jgi:hypothetical protein